MASSSDSGLVKTELSKLTPNCTSIIVVGAIIAKQRPRIFNNARGGDSSERAVWNFTLRDSPLCYINVTCWGSKDGITKLNDRFHMGDVVDIYQPQIEIRRMDDRGEHFRPRVTSPYNLILTENPEAKILRHEGNCSVYYQLLHLPTKPIAGAYTLADVHTRKEKIEGVDLLGIVCAIGRVRTITTRQGTMQQVRDIVILDQTNPRLKISFWDPDLIIHAGGWKTCNTVLFITDVRCEWSSFARSMTATLTSRSVVTVDPIGTEAENLRKYAVEISLQSSTILDQIAGSIPNPSTIQNVMNVQQVLDRAATIMSSTNAAGEEQQFTALIYVVVTQLDLDGLSRITSTRCPFCNAAIVPPLKNCSSAECLTRSHQEEISPITRFDLRLMLSDQTGSLINCRLNGQTAEAVLTCTVQEFLALSDEEKTILKWKFLMERCAVRILVVCAGFRTSLISILSCELADSLEVANRLPHS